MPLSNLNAGLPLALLPELLALFPELPTFFPELLALFPELLALLPNLLTLFPALPLFWWSLLCTPLFELPEPGPLAIVRVESKAIKTSKIANDVMKDLIGHSFQSALAGYKADVTSMKAHIAPVNTLNTNVCKKADMA